MRQLYAEGLKAYAEHVPARIEYDPEGDELADDALHENVQLYRSFLFGDLAELFMTDERLYRSPPPEDAFGRRQTGTPPSRDKADPDRTMLGERQREWFRNGISNSDAAWKLWGNEVLNSPLKYLNAADASFYLNYDAWDGYQYERRRLMEDFDDAGVKDFVALMGDMHSYVAAYLLKDYESARQTLHLPAPEDRVGVEFMTPGVTSNNLAAEARLPAKYTEDVIDEAVRSQNPYIEWFNSSRWGYSVVELTRDHCTYRAYEVDRTVDSADAPKRLLREYRVPRGQNELKRIGGTMINRTLGEMPEYGVVDDAGWHDDDPDGPDVFADSEGADST